LMFETIFGFYGIFLSFPALYVASKIANEWREEDRVIVEAGGTLSNPSPKVEDRERPRSA
jgi:predicted PurR-regulated permease PerM